MLPIVLEWSRPRDGVALAGGIYRPTTDRREPKVYEVGTLESPIVMQLINSPVADGSGFLSRFGMLFDIDKAISAWRYVNAHDDFRNLVFYLNEPSDTQRLNKLNDEYLARTALTPVLRIKDGRPWLYVKPRSLHHLMWLEIAYAAQAGAKAGVCGACGTVFLTGPLTGRRSTAQYCRDQCRAAAQRQRANKGA